MALLEALGGFGQGFSGAFPDTFRTVLENIMRRRQMLESGQLEAGQQQNLARLQSGLAGERAGEAARLQHFLGGLGKEREAGQQEYQTRLASKLRTEEEAKKPLSPGEAYVKNVLEGGDPAQRAALLAGMRTPGMYESLGIPPPQAGTGIAGAGVGGVPAGGQDKYMTIVKTMQAKNATGAEIINALQEAGMKQPDAFKFLLSLGIEPYDIRTR